MSKKTLITAAATATLVASIGFAYAQSTDEEAYPRANINGQVDNNVPKHWARDQVNSDPYDTAAPTAAGPSTTPPADTMSAPADTMSSSTASPAATPPATDANSPWAADSTSTPAATPSGTTSSYDSTSTAAPANTTDSVNQTNGSLSTNVAPSESHVDLNSPNDPIYNLGKSSDERTPRPDRN